MRDRLTQADAGVLTGTGLRAIYLCLEALRKYPPGTEVRSRRPHLPWSPLHQNLLELEAAG